MATTALFTAADLSALPDVSGVTAEEGTALEAIVWGWLKPVLNLTVRPDPVSEELRAWAIELALIYRANPDGLTDYQLETERSTYDRTRIGEILRTAQSGGTVTPGGALSPKGSFPAARAYPDPAERY